MDREILYKGKRLDNSEWVEGYYMNLDGHHYILIGKLDIMNGYPELVKYVINPKTLCQLIQTDKVRVWENDIVRWEDEDDIISVIRYDFEEARFVLDDYGISGCLMEYGFDETAGEFKKLDTNGFGDFYEFNFEVIGNIFDNPELIKSEF